MAPLFDTAIRHYRRAAAETESLSKVFPHTAPLAERSANLRDPVRRKAAIGHLRAARESEVEGLRALAEIVAKL